ncbi:patatin-like phospholipase family protein (plasmid) [Photobacterium sp. DA100]|uniref:patatin-like phospholipase family protein n=1 Tax=Photobacterium sp. DA100 TaxID=3027472 RepID=UPI00247A4473|nr:patatin-like phospholipase family protein [Photobacterium sp. DA100]WEM44520.1 patatin-like phospholipase family protein [Photobacterium sp. DA100]
MRRWKYLLLVVLLSACSSTERSADPVTYTMMPLSIEGIRMWDEFNPEGLNAMIQANTDTWIEEHQDRQSLNYLALSGGGFNGAFSAGILTAWTEQGDRPQFDVVTGISTGAIVSVFAFLGSDYDDVLTELYTETDFDDLFRYRNIFSLVRHQSVLDTSPFEKKVRQIVTDDLVAEIASQNRAGRSLIIGTANIDNQRLALWNIGRIAEHGTPQATALIQELIIASSSIPGAFPARKIEFEQGGQQFDELHVDGGVVRQVFFAPSWVDLRDVNVEQNLYVIRNGSLKSEFQPVSYRLSRISERAISTLMLNQGIGDVEHIYHNARQQGIKFNLAYIDEDFQAPEEASAYSGEFMTELFEYSYQKMQQGQAWQAIPPSLPEFYRAEASALSNGD